MKNIFHFQKEEMSYKLRIEGWGKEWKEENFSSYYRKHGMPVSIKTENSGGFISYGSSNMIRQFSNGKMIFKFNCNNDSNIRLVFVRQ